MKDKITIGNAQAFWGDATGAAAELVSQQPDLDYLTLDYLSELSLSIMAVQRAKSPGLGYARDFVDVIQSLIPHWKAGSKVKVVTNAGGLEPKLCADACLKVLNAAGLKGMKVGIVSGDDVLNEIKNHPNDPIFNNLESGHPVTTIIETLSTANAYLGAKGIVDVLAQGADIVITGRVADPSLTVGPCVAHYGWKWDEYSRIAGATVAGHLIECGTQVTGGISTNWLELDPSVEIGFPIVQIDQKGEFVITKPNNTGGKVSIETVKEQLLYEIGDPARYISPDATVSFLGLSLEQIGPDQITVRGAQGSPPPQTYKVSATYENGYKAEGSLAIFGHQAPLKAKRSAQQILDKMKRTNKMPARSCVEYLGAGGLIPGLNTNANSLECVMRIAVADHNKEIVDYFTRLIAPMVTSGSPGTTGYTSGRPQVRSVYGYWPCLIPVKDVQIHTQILAVP